MDPITEQLKPTPLKDAAKAANHSFVVSPPNPSRAQSAILLRRTAYFKDHPDASSIPQEEVGKENEIVRRENEARKNSILLPTMGMEIEYPISSESKQALNLLSIRNEKESGPKNLWEIQSPWSYSSDTQIAFLQQLQRLGIIPLVPGLGRNDLDPQAVLSLHLNFGIPLPKADAEAFFSHYDAEMSDVVDCLTLAFVSPERIAMRKTNISFRVTNAHVEPTEKIIPNPSHPDTVIHRFEMRPFEVTDSLAPALIHSSQPLVAGLIASMVDAEPVVFGQLNPLEQERAKKASVLFAQFRQQFAALRKQYGNFRAGFMDYDATNAASLLRDLDKRDGVSAFRTLVTNAARQLSEVFALPQSPTPRLQQN